ncbi:MAG: AsmA-like C-terminal region-containing protein [Saprospiraceae bacterium]
MSKWIKKLFFWLAAIIGLFVLTAVIIAAFFEKQVGKKLISEINKQLETELTVESFDLSLLSSFPDASATLYDVKLDDNMDGALIEAKEMSFNFGLLSLFGEMIKVHSIVIEDGALFIQIDRKGNTNYDIIKSSKVETLPEDSGVVGLAISMEEAQLKDVEFIYIDERVKQEMKMLVRDAIISGEFSSDRFALTSFAKMKSKFIELDGERIFVNKDLVYDATVDVDMAKGRYLIQDVDLGVESNMFKVTGTILQNKKDTDLDLRITSEECSLGTMLELLPEEQLEYFKDFESTGTFLFDAIIKGKYGAKKMPAIQASFGLEDGTIVSPKLGYKLKEVTFGARFNNGNKHTAKTSVFKIDDFKGYFNRELITSSLVITNLEKPKIDFKLDGVLPLEAVYGLLDDKRIKDGDGEIEIENFRLRGLYSDMIKPSRISKVRSSGTIEFDDASLTVNKEELIIDRGSIQILDNSLKLNKVKLEGAGTELYLSGKFLNLLPVLLADSLNSQAAELKFQATLDAPILNLNRIEKMLAPPIDQSLVRRGMIDVDSVNIAQTKKRERITQFLQGKFQAKIDEIVYRKIKASDFSGSMGFDNNEMTIKGRVKGMEGAFNVDGKAVFAEKPYLNAKIDCDEVNVRQFFDQMENFGLEILQAKNVKGKLNTQLAVTARWDSDGTFLTDELKVLGDMKITNGELINLKLLYAFADYIKLRDLKHIKFTTLQNFFEIKKSKLYIPSMFLQSNALNLTVSGTHSFDNRIDYNIKINAGQVIGNLFKRYDRTKRPIEAKRDGWFNLYYRIYGTVDKYQVKRDKYRVKKQFDRSKRHKKLIEKALLRKFDNIENYEEPSDWKDEVENNDPDPMDDKTTPEEDDFIEGFEAEPTRASKVKEREPENSRVSVDDKANEEDEDEYIDWDNK